MFNKPQKQPITQTLALTIILTVVLLNSPAKSEEGQASSGYGLDTYEIKLERIKHKDDSESSSITKNEPKDQPVDITSLRRACRSLITDATTWTKERYFGKERHWPNPILSTMDCRESLLSFFSTQTVMKYIMPMPILTWADIFKNIEKKINVVISTLQNPNCSIPASNLSTVLHDQCDASALVEIAILMESCISVHEVRREQVVSGSDFSGPPEYNRHSHYRSNYTAEKRSSDLNKLNAIHVPTSEYSKRLDVIDITFFRTAYLRWICEDYEKQVYDLYNVHEHTKTSSLPANLWKTASRLGSPIALDSYVPRGMDAIVFMMINPVQTILQQAKDSELTHDNAYLHESRWNSELVNKEYSVLTGVGDLKTFRSFLKQENIQCSNECVYEDMYAIYKSLSIESSRSWSRFFTSAQYKKLANDRVYWGLVADRLANELQVNINRDLLYERFIDDGLERIDANGRIEIQSLAIEKSNEILLIRSKVFDK